MELFCRYQGYPPHHGDGYHNRISLADEASLNLTKVREEDQGLYECKIVYLNRLPTAENGTWVYLEVRGESSMLNTSAFIIYYTHVIELG